MGFVAIFLFWAVFFFFPVSNNTCFSERDARTLFVKNLPYSATIDDLKELFESAVDVRLPQGPTGSNRG